MSFQEAIKDKKTTLTVLKAIHTYQDLKLFSKVLEAYSTEWKSISPVAHNYERAQDAAKTVIEDPLVNFRTLSVLSIWVNEGPANRPMKAVESEFGSKVSEVLAEHDLV